MDNLAGSSKSLLGPKTIIALVCLVIFLLFIIQNTEIVAISFLFWKIHVSRVILLLGSLLIGLLIGLVIGWEAAAKKKKY